MSDPIEIHRVKPVLHQPRGLPALPKYIVLTAKAGSGDWDEEHVWTTEHDSAEAWLARILERNDEGGYTSYVLGLETPDA